MCEVAHSIGPRDRTRHRMGPEPIDTHIATATATTTAAAIAGTNIVWAGHERRPDGVGQGHAVLHVIPIRPELT